jgi:hypothetical protein
MKPKVLTAQKKLGLLLLFILSKKMIKSHSVDKTKFKNDKSVKTRNLCGLVEFWNMNDFFLKITGAFLTQKRLEDISSHSSCIFFPIEY